MIRRIVCLFCALLLLVSVLPAAAEETGERHHYDLDLTFSLNADAFPELQRSRASGYADLLSRIGLKGSAAWNDDVLSMNNALTLYYRDNPSLSYPFRFYGTKKRLFITSTLVNKKVIFFNMAALMEFAVKAKNTLGISLPYIALLYPYATEFVFQGMTKAWNETVGVLRESGTIPVEAFKELSALWSQEITNSPDLQRWIMAVDSGSDVTGIVDQEFRNLPGYYEAVTGGEPLTVTLGEGTEIWQSAAGKTLFSREESDGSLTLKTDLPVSENGYVPSLSYVQKPDGQKYSISLDASILLDKSEPAEAETEAAPEEAPADETPEEGSEPVSGGTETGEAPETGSDKSDAGEDKGEDEDLGWGDDNEGGDVGYVTGEGEDLGWGDGDYEGGDVGYVTGEGEDLGWGDGDDEGGDVGYVTGEGEDLGWGDGDDEGGDVGYVTGEGEDLGWGDGDDEGGDVGYVTGEGEDLGWGDGDDEGGDVGYVTGDSYNDEDDGAGYVTGDDRATADSDEDSSSAKSSRPAAREDNRPDTLLHVTAEGSGIPATLPADSSFSLSVSVTGSVYPNYTFLIQGSTTSDGKVYLALCKPAAPGAEPVEIFRVSGTVRPLDPIKLPNYQKRSLKHTYNVFSFNEQRLSDFTSEVLPSLIRGILSFVEAAPASACQSLLDDLTDIGILDMLIQY